jgi:hypothetical protein
VILEHPPQRACSASDAARLLGYRSPSMVHKRLNDPVDPLAGFRAPNGRWVIDLEIVERLAELRAALTHPFRGTDSAEPEHPLEFNLRFAESRAAAAELTLAAERYDRLTERVSHLETLLAAREAELARVRAQLAALASQLTHATATITALTIEQG